MYATLSSDEGATWASVPYPLYTETGSVGPVGYSAMVELASGIIGQATYGADGGAGTYDGSHVAIWWKPTFQMESIAAPTPPVAGFTASPSAGSVPLLVNFTDTSTNSPRSWAWDFGDGNTSTLQNPSNSFTTAGTYIVRLTVTNFDGSDSTTHNVIAANGPVTLVLDHFTDTNGTDLSDHTPDVGPVPVAQHGQLLIEANEAIWNNSGGAPGAVYTYDCGVSDYTASAIVTCPSGGDGGLWIRHASGHGYLFQMQRSSGNNAYLYYFNGSFNLLATGSFTPDGNPHTLQVVASGSTLTCSIDGTTQITYASATNNQTSTLIGIRADVNATTFDDFTVTT